MNRNGQMDGTDHQRVYFEVAYECQKFDRIRACGRSGANVVNRKESDLESSQSEDAALGSGTDLPKSPTGRRRIHRAAPGNANFRGLRYALGKDQNTFGKDVATPAVAPKARTCA